MTRSQLQASQSEKTPGIIFDAACAVLILMLIILRFMWLTQRAVSPDVV